jgi:putative oxidoreductase
MFTSDATRQTATTGAAAVSGPARTHATDAGLLLVRLVAGLTMAAHGAGHLLGWFGGFGADGTAAFFAHSGYHASTLMAVVAGTSEILGGLGLAAGLLTPLASAAVIGTMVNAIAVKWSGGYFIPKGFEYEVLMATVAAAIAIAGPGRYSLDRGLPVLREHRIGYGVAAVVIGVVAGALTLVLFR